MDWTKTILEVIDMRSFSNLWFWIVLAAIWSSASHYVMGVPFDMIQRARRHEGQALTDLEDMVRINVNRMLYISHVAGLWLLGFATFMLTGLLVLGFWYEIEFAQAVALIAVPMTLVGLMTLSQAQKFATDMPVGDLLFRRLTRHRFWTQVIGMVSIFITATFGMYQNLVVAPGF